MAVKNGQAGGYRKLSGTKRKSGKYRSAYSK